jgi:hypothetical protein
MFFKRVMLGVVGVAVLSALALAGCQSTSTAQAGPAAATHAVMCSKCQAAWVNTPTRDGRGRIVGYAARREMVCPDCRSAVANFFATGKLEHACKSCGGDMQVCELCTTP